MQHFKEFLLLKKVNILDILKLNCEVTEKIDGSALQIYNNNDNLIFGKRTENPFKYSTNLLTEIDLLTNNVYYQAYIYLNNYKDIIKKYKILNFEIFSNEEKSINKHIINYNNQFKNNIVLLSGLSLNNDILSIDELDNISKQLNISSVNILWSGVLSDDIITNIKKYKDNNTFLWNYITDIFKIDKDKFIEGIVFTFKEHNKIKRVLKIQNPLFHVMIMDHLYNENKLRYEINLEKYFNFIIKNTILNNNESDKDTIAKRLLKLYINFENNELTDIEKNLKNVDILRNLKINTLLAHKIYDQFPDNIENIKYPYLLNFILFGFMHKRKKYPLWCSKEYQNNILNPFIDNLFKNIQN